MNTLPLPTSLQQRFVDKNLLFVDICVSICTFVEPCFPIPVLTTILLAAVSEGALIVTEALITTLAVGTVCRQKSHQNI